MSPGVAYTRAKYLRVWVLAVTVEVDSTEKNRWVTIIVLAWSACIITNVFVWAKMGEAKTLPCALLTQRITDKYKIITRTSIKEDQDGRLRLLLRKNLCVPRRDVLSLQERGPKMYKDLWSERKPLCQGFGDDNDKRWTFHLPPTGISPLVGSVFAGCRFGKTSRPVSYTHLTLPTIYSV